MSRDGNEYFSSMPRRRDETMTTLLSNIKYSTLQNGLKVILKPLASSPAISNWIWYRAGSRYEVPGMTGVSHWVEHMLFKGSKSFTKDMIDRLLSKHGGTFNAFTSQDFTAYFETLPSRQLDLALRIEADRMQNAAFDPAEVEAERTVVISEREGYENEPSYVLEEEVLSAAFRAHPYGQPVIGWRSDLERLTRDDLYSYYRKFYAPDNATLVLVGRFDEEYALRRIDELFSPIPRSHVKKGYIPREPPQAAERRVTIRKPGNTEYLMVVFHSPSISEDDAYPMMLLDAIMSGAKAVRSGPTFERSGRLFRALVERGIAAYAYSSFMQSQDPNVLVFFAVAQAGVTSAKVERALLKEIDRLRSKPPSKSEMGMALNQTEAQFSYATDGVTAQGYLLGSFETRIGYDYLATLRTRLKQVTPQDVMRVANKYLVENNRTIGTFIPSAEEIR